MPQAEHLHRLGHGGGLALQLHGAGGNLLHQRGVLLGDVVHLRHRLVDLRDPRQLLAGAGADLRNHRAHLTYRLQGVTHGLLRGLGEPIARQHLVGGLVDELLDLLGCTRGALCQGAHLGGHDGKAPPLLAGTSSLHGGVQRQDVGLESDAVDDLDDLANAL